MLEVRGIVSIYARAGDSHIPHCPSPSGRGRKNRSPWNVKRDRRLKPRMKVILFDSVFVKGNDDDCELRESLFARWEPYHGF